MNSIRVTVHIAPTLSENHRVAISNAMDKITSDPEHSFFGATYSFDSDSIAPNERTIAISSPLHHLANLALATELSRAQLDVMDASEDL